MLPNGIGGMGTRKMRELINLEKRSIEGKIWENVGKGSGFLNGECGKLNS
jgi:hypothetical protein